MERDVKSGIQMTSLGNIIQDGGYVTFTLKKLEKLSLSPVGSSVPKIPRSYDLVPPRDIALRCLPAIMRLGQWFSLQEAPCFAFPSCLQGFHTSPWHPERWPDLKWPRAKDTQSCVEAASMPFCEELTTPEGEAQVLKTGQLEVGGDVFSSVKSAQKCFLMLSCVVRTSAF